MKKISEWELFNLSVEEILEMIERFTDEELDEVKAASSRSGKHIQELGQMACSSNQTLFMDESIRYLWSRVGSNDRYPS